MRDRPASAACPEAIAGVAESSEETTVFVVDDHESVRTSIRELLESVGLRVQEFSNAIAFLKGYKHNVPGCVVLDVRMPGLSGMDLLDELPNFGIRLPAIIVTGHGDVPMCARAMKSGAIDFLEKPFREKAMLDCVRRAIALDAKDRAARKRQQEIAVRTALLTPREQEVMDMLLSGKANKFIAARLGISRKTLDIHRANILEKMQAESVAHLAHIMHGPARDSSAESSSS